MSARRHVKSLASRLLEFRGDLGNLESIDVGKSRQQIGFRGGCVRASRRQLHRFDLGEAEECIARLENGTKSL